jgi:hypothetical protein
MHVVQILQPQTDRNTMYAQPGLASFTTVVHSIEARVRNMSRLGAEAVVDGGAGGPPPMSKKLKLTKEEAELQLDGRDFLDDSELLGDSDSEEADKLRGDFRVHVLSDNDLDSSSSAANGPEDDSQASSSYSGARETARARFLARHPPDAWKPPAGLAKDLAELKKLNAQGTAQRLSAKQEAVLSRIDKAACQVLPGHRRTKAYLARVLQAFPPPVTRAHVVAHLKRLALRRRLEDAEKKLDKALARCALALDARLARPGAVVLAAPGPAARWEGLGPALAALEDSGAFTALEQLALDDIAAWAAGLARQPSPQARLDVALALRVVVEWGARIAPCPPRAQSAPRCDALVAAREWLFAAQSACAARAYFVWDAESRKWASRAGALVLHVAKLGTALDAWVRGRVRELRLPSSTKGRAAAAKPNLKAPSLVRRMAAAETRLAKAFPSLALAKQARLGLALREVPGAGFFQLDEVALRVEEDAAKPKPGPPPPPSSSPQVQQLQLQQLLLPMVPPQQVAPEEVVATAALAPMSGAHPSKPLAPAGDMTFVAVRGARFESREFDPGDFALDSKV